MDSVLNWKWKQILNVFKELNVLEKVEQNKVYHGEGNVLNHTKLVCKELINLFEFKALTTKEKEILFLASLFHDIGKSICAIEYDGVITSPKHAVKGEIIARSIFYKNYDFIDFNTREQVVKLIRYHGFPPFFVDKHNPEKYLFEISQVVNLKYLYILSKADCLGRICSYKDKNNLLDNIEMFKVIAIENDCFDKPKSFPSNLSRFEYFRKEDRNITFEAYDNSNCEVILLSGLPASGKDTWINENNINLPVISLDNIREKNNIKPTDNQTKVINEAREMAKVYLRNKQSFIWNATNITKDIRKKLIDLFTNYNAKVKIIYLEVPYKELIERNELRKNHAPVPIHAISNMIDKLEIPSVIEACNIEYHIKT